jgi:hypothetical protein
MMYVMDNRAAVLSLIQQALGPTGRAEWTDPDQLEIELSTGGRHRFQVVGRGVEAGRAGAEPPWLRVLERVDSGELERLRHGHGSFVSLRGVVRIEAPGLLIDRTDLTPPKRSGDPPRRSAFSDRASLIPRWLFEHPVEEAFSVSGIAHEAGVSASVASYAIQDLERLGVVEANRRGRAHEVRLVDHRLLIEAWCRSYDWRDNASLAVHAPIASPHRFMSRLQTLLEGSAWTLHAGASLIQPLVELEDLHVYVAASSARDLERLAHEKGWLPHREGRLHLLAPYYERSMFPEVRKLDGIPVVSTAQLIVDLWHYPVRGREQAELLLEKHVAGLR